MLRKEPRNIAQRVKAPSGEILLKCIWVLMVFCLLFGCGYKTRPRPITATIPGEIGLPDAHAYPDKIVFEVECSGCKCDGSPATDISGFKVWRLAQKVGDECENCEDKKILYANIDFQNPSNAIIEQGRLHTQTHRDTG